MITKSERGELRSIVRQQYKVLRAEVRQREAEMLAEIEAQLSTKYADADAAFEATLQRMREIVKRANDEIDEVPNPDDAYWLSHDYQGPTLHRSDQRDREALRRTATAELSAKVQAAKTRLEREEADLLRQLATQMIESEEAMSFLKTIPTVAELVPAVRLKELEAGVAFDFDGPFPN